MLGGARQALAAALLIPVLACSSGDDGARDRTPPSTVERPSPGATTTTEVPVREGDPLVVIEQGVASYPDPFDVTATLGGYAVVLENPNVDVMATGIRVITRILDPAGVELLVDSALLNGILPGQRMAVGRTLIEPIENPTQLDVTFEVGAWLLPADTTGRFSAEGVVTEPEEAGGSITRFRVVSTWPSAEEGVDATAVYRAADGRILGGESISLDVSPDAPSPAQIRLLSPIPDLATTEVFVGRGFAAQTVG